MKQTRVKIKESKSWVFEQRNKADKSVARLTNKKREGTQRNNIRNETGYVTTDTTEI